uniref:Peptidase M12B domain-containing protein n=1 Tax=Timema poppense TaxID=170557 RepID=A0A7R9GTW0_TIMPO|nr:unnamed protein product [Timema poppensis]
MARLGERARRFTRDVKDYQLVYPCKVTSEGEFLSHYVPHHFQLSNYHDTEAQGAESHRPEDRVHYKLKFNGEDHHLVLVPNHHLLAPGMIIETRTSGGTKDDPLSNVELRPADDLQCFYHGHVRGHEGSKTALSTCYGLSTGGNLYEEPDFYIRFEAGFVRTKRGTYMIEPAMDHEPVDGLEHPHLLFEYDPDPLLDSVKTTNCGTRDNLEEALSQRKSRRSAHSERLKVDSYTAEKSEVMYLETLVVSDWTFLQYHKELDVDNYMLTIMNMAYNMYHDATLGVLIHLTIVRHIKLEEEKDEMNTKVSAASEETLESFCKWQNEMNPGDDSHPNHHDVAVLLTRTDICDTDGDCGLLGIAKMAGTCEPTLSCAVNEDNGMKLGYTVTHEVGHTLGMDHDLAERGCPGKLPSGEFTVMNPGVSMKITGWSNCSQDYIRHYVDLGFSYCLYDVPTDHDFEMTDILPGVMYGGDYQCKTLVNSQAKECEMGLACDSLNCEIPDYGCVQTHVPAAAGTKCGENKWCYARQCLQLGERPGATDGGWGEWSDWSECSRTCGSGVAYSERQCNNPSPTHGGRFCIGDRRRHNICATEPCDVNDTPFRDLQCSEFNDWVYPEDEKKHTWKGYYKHGENPCSLYCLSENKVLTALKPKVVDGTTCYRGIRDICIGGTCKEVPCDLNLTSNAVEDVCGVCRGDGTSCINKVGSQTFIAENKALALKLPRSVLTSYPRPRLGTHYQLLIVWPVGALTLPQPTHTDDYRDSATQSPLLDDWGHSPAEAGRFSNHLYGEQTPLNRPPSPSWLCRSSIDTHITCEASNLGTDDTVPSIRKTAEKIPPAVLRFPRWEDLALPSLQFGLKPPDVARVPLRGSNLPGLPYRMKKLVNIPVGATNIRVEETEPTKSYLILRDTEKKVALLKGTELGMFDISGMKVWIGMIKYQQEAFNIPGPTQTPLAFFVQPIENVTMRYSMGEKAMEQRKPVFIWDFLDWSKCSALCGPGTQLSQPKCVEKIAGVVDDSHCQNMEKPSAKTQRCEIAECVPRWMLGDWQNCEKSLDSNSCKKSRLVKCIKPTGEGQGASLIIPEGSCGVPKPDTERPCVCEKTGKKKRCDRKKNRSMLSNEDQELDEDGNTDCTELESNDGASRHSLAGMSRTMQGTSSNSGDDSDRDENEYNTYSGFDWPGQSKESDKENPSNEITVEDSDSREEENEVYDNPIHFYNIKNDGKRDENDDIKNSRGMEDTSNVDRQNVLNKKDFSYENSDKTFVQPQLKSTTGKINYNFWNKFFNNADETDQNVFSSSTNIQEGTDKGEYQVKHSPKLESNKNKNDRKKSYTLAKVRSEIIREKDDDDTGDEEGSFINGTPESQDYETNLLLNEYPYKSTYKRESQYNSEEYTQRDSPKEVKEDQENNKLNSVSFIDKDTSPESEYNWKPNSDEYDYENTNEYLNDEMGGDVEGNKAMWGKASKISDEAFSKNYMESNPSDNLDDSRIGGKYTSSDLSDEENMREYARGSSDTPLRDTEGLTSLYRGSNRNIANFERARGKSKSMKTSTNKKKSRTKHEKPSQDVFPKGCLTPEIIRHIPFCVDPNSGSILVNETGELVGRVPVQDTQAEEMRKLHSRDDIIIERGKTIKDLEPLDELKLTVNVDKTESKQLEHLPEGIQPPGENDKKLELEGKDVLQYMQKMQENSNNKSLGLN